MRRHILLVVMAAFLVFFILAEAVAPAYASLLDEKLKEKEEIERELGKHQSSLKQSRKDEAALKKELEELDRRIQELEQELQKINRDIAATEAEIARVEEKLKAAEEELAKKEETFKRRLRIMYEQGNVTYLDVLLGASSFSDFLSRLNYLQLIAAKNQQLIESIRAERDEIAAMKEELEGKKNQLEAMRRRILANREEVNRIVASRRVVLRDLQEEIARKEKAIRDLEREAQELDRLILELIGKDGGSGITSLRSPLAGSYYVSSEFGWRKCPMPSCQGKPSPSCGVCHGSGSNYHGGIDLVPLGTRSVVAAETGTVVLARWYGGYGNCIIIDHGEGFSTLYAHLSVIAVSVGQKVLRGQHIGTAGTTGNSTGIHLHFEVREYDVRVNPRKYYHF
ncbi:MAG: peptidoglycan DD-metalloendopeptidase family protein [Firmicutes bacterium]|nr:peptidoglycan DD-metalloendopeptidase family protein [Bacillota bacterium]